MSTKMRRVIVMINLKDTVVHHHKIYAGIHRYADECGRWTCSVNQFPELLLKDNARETPIDGIVGRITEVSAELAKKQNVPMVNVWVNTPAKGLPSVFMDAREAGRMAARHLLARGFSKFGFIGHQKDLVSDVQAEGFREVLSARNIHFSERWIPHSYADSAAGWQRFLKNINAWMDGWQTPMGVFATHDNVCRYVAEACHERNLKVPQDVALIGCFNEKVICENPPPALTSIDCGFEQVGYQAAALLDRIMNGEPAPTDPVLIPPTTLLPRQSSDAFAVDDPLVAKALRFIAEHAHQPIDVGDVASHVPVSRRTLARAFERTMDRTVHDTITHMRMERVKRYLIESEMPLKSVAQECGFTDAIHMCKAFQRNEGTSPSDFRKVRTLNKRE